jgi:DeoR family glycerol-3-phosphate regulon repressor
MAPVRIGHLSQVDTFITDRCNSEEIRRICHEAEVQLIETGL